MHLNSLKIKNFRILEDVEVGRLGDVNLIVGKNNSGKSTVLEALLLLATGFHPETVRFVNILKNGDKFGLTNSNEDHYSSIKSFLNSKISKSTSLETIFIGNEDKYLKFGYLDDFEKEDIEDFERYQEIPYCHIEDKKTNSVFRVVSNYGLFFDQNSITQKEWRSDFPCGYVSTSPMNINKLAIEWDGIALTNDEELVLDMLKLVEPNIKKFAFLANDDSGIRVPYVLLGDTSRVSLHEMGDGVLRLLQIIMKVIKARNGFLFIDEFENGLHYSIQKKVWELIFELAQRFDIQVFATTHSWDCIESSAQVAKEREDTQGVLFRMGKSVKKSNAGQLIVTVFDEDELYHLTKQKIEVR